MVPTSQIPFIFFFFLAKMSRCPCGWNTTIRLLFSHRFRSAGHFVTPLLAVMSSPLFTNHPYEHCRIVCCQKVIVGKEKKTVSTSRLNLILWDLSLIKRCNSKKKNKSWLFALRFYMKGWYCFVSVLKVATKCEGAR